MAQADPGRIVIKSIVVCFVAMVVGFADPVSADEAISQDREVLKLVQTIPLPGVKGRLDHMAVDLAGDRLFVAASDNNTLEVVDLAAGKVTKSLGGFRATQGLVPRRRLQQALRVEP